MYFSGRQVRIYDDTLDPLEYTVEIWFKKDASGFGGFMGRAAPDSDLIMSLRFWVDANNKVNVGITDHCCDPNRQTAFKQVTGTTSVVPGDVYHVAATVRAFDFLRLYVNGVEEGQPAPVNVPDFSGTQWAGSGHWRIGSSGNNGPGWIGQLDEWAAYDHVLSPGAIANHYTVGSGNFVAIASEQLFGLSDWWGIVPVNFFADPVNTATGNYAHAVTDIELPGVSLPFTFSRTYNSGDATVGPLGRGWTHSLAASLAVQPNGDVKLRAGNGQQLLFTRQVDGTFTDPPGGRVTLTSIAGGYEAARNDQLVYRFDSSGRLVEIRDRSGNDLTVAYGADGALSTVTDTVGRQITFAHTNGLLTAVVLPDGRDVTFGYTSGQLTSSTDLRDRITTYTYDAGGRLATIVDANGHTEVRNVYGADGRIIEQYDAFNNRTSFAWDSATQTSTATDPAGATWVDVYDGNVLQRSTAPAGTATFGWDPDLGLTAGTDLRGNQFTMTYDAAGNMLTRTAPAPLSYVETWSYDARNNVTSYRDGRGNTTTYEYDTAGRLITETRPGGVIRGWTYTAAGQVETATDARSGITRYGYDATGNLTSVQTPLGNRTTYTYDAAGRVVSMVEPRGNVQGGNPDDYRTSYTYDAAGNVLTETDALGRVTTYTYDNAGNLAAVTNPMQRVTRYSYNDADELISEEAPDGSITSYAYDTRGLMTSKTEPLGRVTTYTYDSARRLATMVTPRGNVTGADPAQFRWSFGYDANGNQTTVTYPLGGVTTRSHDVLNRLTSIRNPRNFTTSYEYDANGNQTKVTDPLAGVTFNTFDPLNRRTSMNNPRGFTTSYEYDANGNQTEITTATGAITTFAYDAENRLTSTVEPRGNVAGANPDDYTTTHGYDQAGNRLTETDPLGNVTTFTYDRVRNLISRRDALTHTTTFGYDALNQLTSVTAPDSRVTSYGYDLVGNLTSRKDAKNRETTYGYDAARRLISLVTPANQRWTYEYDANSNQTKMVDAAGNVTPGDPNDGTTTRTFDRLDRLSGIDYSDTTPDVSVAYDAVGNRTTMTDGSGTETYTYDALDRRTKVSRGTDGFDYVYDANGNVTQRKYPDATVFDYTYDADDRLSSLVTSGNTTSYAYDIASNLTQTTLPASNGHVETRVYDRAGRLTEVKNAKGATVLSKSTLSLDAVGNPTKIVAQSGTTTYKYDLLDRLTEACTKTSCPLATDPFIRYTYDEVGNRLTETRPTSTTTYSYNTADQLSSSTTGATTTTYTYDANGNQRTAGTTTYTYDRANRLKTAKVGSTTTTYSYDGDGKRLQGSTGTQTSQKTNYVWDTANSLPALAMERDGAGALRRRYAHGMDLVSMTSGGADYHYHYDWLGSVTNLTSSTGVKQWTYTYEPFGKRKTETKNSTTAPANLMRFTGELIDTATSLYHLRARQYDPKIGRFLQTDPAPPDIADPYVSAYAYVNNRTTVLIDPSGERGTLANAFCTLTRLFGLGCADSVTDTEERLQPHPCSGAVECDPLHRVETPTKERQKQYFYRGGSSTNTNFTPRYPQDTVGWPYNGLSVFSSPDLVWAHTKERKAQKLHSAMVLAIPGLLLIPDDAILGHFFLAEGNSSEAHEAWAKTREHALTSPHELTTLLKLTIEPPEVRRP